MHQILLVDLILEVGKMFEKKLNWKGFIGPIGDDLPSLIPLIFALIIFFSAFTSSLNSFNSENSAISVKLEALKISRTLRGNGFVENFEQFQKTCETVKNSGIKFQAGLVEFKDVTSFSSKNDIKFIEPFGSPPVGVNSEDFKFVCFSNSVSEEDKQENLPPNAFSINLVYPIALQYNTVVLPVHLVVTAWT